MTATRGPVAPRGDTAAVPAAAVERELQGHGEPLSAETDLAVRWLGGSAIAASDDAFGDMENLVRSEPPAFEPGRYGTRGEIVDGWESRRHRAPGNDWVIVRLGAAGTVSSVDIDTSFFTGNFPESARLEATGGPGYTSIAELLRADVEWVEIVPRSELRGDAHNVFPVSDQRRFTHVRLSIYPDGGVARLRVLGRIVPDPRLFDGLTIDLAALENGGRIVTSSDGFYTSAGSMIRPGRARTMGEGWETRRRRDEGHDYAVIHLAAESMIRQLVVDTSHFKYNASESVALYASDVEPVPSAESDTWWPILERTRLQPDLRHFFAASGNGSARAIRIDAFPDGGIARVEAAGSLAPAGRLELGLRWFNALPSREARACLRAAGVSAPDSIAEARPLARDWRDHVARLDGRRTASEKVRAALASLLEGERPGS